MDHSRRTLALLALATAPLLAVLSALATAGPAAAHTGATAVAGPTGSTVITYSFSHGCDGRPTIGLRAKLPAGAWDVVPTDPAGWSSTVSTTEVHWTGPGIPDGTTATFPVAMILTDPVGSTVMLPAVQQCTDGAENAWIDVTTTNDGTEATRPSPRIVVPANSTQPPSTTTTSTSTTAGPATTARMAANSSAVTTEGSPSSASGRWVFAGVCAVIVIGAVVLFLRHRRSAQE